MLGLAFVFTALVFAGVGYKIGYSKATKVKGGGTRPGDPVEPK